MARQIIAGSSAVSLIRLSNLDKNGPGISQASFKEIFFVITKSKSCYTTRMQINNLDKTQ